VLPRRAARSKWIFDETEKGPSTRSSASMRQDAATYHRELWPQVAEFQSEMIEDEAQED
jgi:hypothetical protein